MKSLTTVEADGVVSTDVTCLMKGLSYRNSTDIYACLCRFAIKSEYVQVCDPSNTSQVVANAISSQFCRLTSL